MTGNAEFTPQTIIKVFEQLVKAIAFYGAEKWGTDAIKYKDKYHLIKSLTNPMCEKLNASICGYALGVHRKTQTRINKRTFHNE